MEKETALKILIELHDDLSLSEKTALETFIPELVESEDEKIRKEIVRFIQMEVEDEMVGNKWLAWLEKQQDNTNIEQVFRPLAGCCIDTAAKQAIEQQKIGKNVVLAFNGCYIPVENNTVDEIVNEYNAWLEKQSEQNPTDKTEPKFKIGDWLQYRAAQPFLVDEITEQGYINGNSCLPFEWEKEIHLWTIQDAKVGDVLSYVTDEEDLWIMIYWSLYEPYEGYVHYHALLVNDNFGDKGTCCIRIDDLKPATKEQRDTLFTKMKEAGYTWNEKELKLEKL